MIAVIDYNIGNISAVVNMLQRLGVKSIITSDPEQIAQADKIILPGNGAFDACMINLRASGLIPLLEQRVLQEKIPVLGICVGAQMLGHSSEEGQESGLGWLDFCVRRFPDLPSLRIPHMGWNQVKAPREHPIIHGIDADTRFYFVHSYYMLPRTLDLVLLTAEYGISFAAGVARDNMIGVQFHPEKSHRYGKQLLANFCQRH